MKGKQQSVIGRKEIRQVSGVRAVMAYPVESGVPRRNFESVSDVAGSVHKNSSESSLDCGE